jgi:Icc-related predicted phosphoesterase
MRVAVHSDLHFETHDDGGRTLVNEIPDADVLIVAGDLADCNSYSVAFDLLCTKFAAVLYTIGNHDLWGASFAKTRKALAIEVGRHPNLHVLDNSVIEIGGVRFVGATMFFPYDPLNSAFQGLLDDFIHIENYQEDVYAENAKAMKFLNDIMFPGDVVITHHLPCLQSVHERYRDSVLNRFFLNNMELLIRAMAPAVWIHGHTHDSFDYLCDQTRIVCNPFGFPYLMNPKWKADYALVLGD